MTASLPRQNKIICSNGKPSLWVPKTPFGKAEPSDSPFSSPKTILTNLPASNLPPKCSTPTSTPMAAYVSIFYKINGVQSTMYQQYWPQFDHYLTIPTHPHQPTLKLPKFIKKTENSTKRELNKLLSCHGKIDWCDYSNLVMIDTFCIEENR